MWPLQANFLAAASPRALLLARVLTLPEGELKDEGSLPESLRLGEDMTCKSSTSLAIALLKSGAAAAVVWAG